MSNIQRHVHVQYLMNLIPNAFEFWPRCYLYNCRRDALWRKERPDGYVLYRCSRHVGRGEDHIRFDPEWKWITEIQAREVIQKRKAASDKRREEENQRRREDVAAKRLEAISKDNREWSWNKDEEGTWEGQSYRRISFVAQPADTVRPRGWEQFTVTVEQQFGMGPAEKEFYYPATISIRNMNYTEAGAINCLLAMLKRAEELATYWNVDAGITK